jgi:hypothetical protein
VVGYLWNFLQGSHNWFRFHVWRVWSAKARGTKQ